MVHPNELDQQIENLRTLQKSYDQIAGAAEAYNTGKVALAENITAKGIPAAATETLPELAEKVLDIQQTTTVIDGGDMYAAQLTGDGALWNLYDVLADMKSRFMGAGQYECLIVCEYYKGYDSLQLQGADAYYTCDGDFYDVSSPLHTWHDSDNGKANRWVCFLFATDGARFNITNTAISPRSMYIGGHIGTIEYFTNGRLTEFVCGVEETDVVDNFLCKGYTQEWNNNTIINGVKNVLSGINSDFVFSGTSNLIINFISETILSNANPSIVVKKARTAVIGGVKNVESNSNATLLDFQGNTDMSIIMMPDLEEFRRSGTLFYGGGLKSIQLPKLRILNSVIHRVVSNFGADFNDLTIGGLETDLNCATWNPTNVLADSTKKAQLIDNIKNHILARVSDATGGTQLVFTISTNMYNAIASENITWNDQTMTLADAFLTKNWLLAGA